MIPFRESAYWIALFVSGLHVLIREPCERS